MNEGYEEGEVCNRNGCKGIIEVDDEGCCSCHINPPCSYCTDDKHYCPECGWSAKEGQFRIKTYKPTTTPTFVRKSVTERLKELKGDKIEWIDVTPRDHYYFMVKKGKYPEGTTREEIISHFNVCFGYAYLNMDDGVFEIKYYTD